MSALGVFLFSFVLSGFSERVVLIVAASDGVWKAVTDVRGVVRALHTRARDERRPTLPMRPARKL